MNAIVRYLRMIREGHAVILVAALLVLASLTPTLGARLGDPVLLAASAAHKTEQTGTALAAIDRRSITELGPWPWDAAALSKVLDELALGEAKLVVLDPAVSRAMPQSASRSFWTRDGTPWLLAGYSFYASLSELPEGYEEEKGRAEVALAKLALPASPGDDSTLVSVAGVEEAASKEIPDASLAGFANLFPDEDGVVRSQPLAARLGHRVYPALALGAAAAAAGVTPLVSEDASGRPVGASIGERETATGADAGMDIDYALCPSEDGTISALDLHEGNFPTEAINGRIVVLGVTEPTAATTRRTPVGPLPEATVYACEVAQIQSARAFRSFADQPWISVAIALAGLLYIFVLRRAGMGVRAFFAIAVAGAAMVAGVVLCVSSGILLPVVHFALALVAMWLASLVWQAVSVDMPARAAAGALGFRLSPRDIRRASSDPHAFAPDGPAREVAALALDIRGFGTISRTLGCRSCSFLRGFRKLVAGRLMDNGAFIDCWSADECRAAFGAISPREDRAQAACRSAVAILHAIAQARQELASSYGVEKPRLGIGIWNGEAYAGELGPEGARSFGVTGPAMEAAATLRALNRTYRTSVLVCDDIARAAENSFRFRPLDPVQLHASERPVVIHELVGEIGIILPQLAVYLAARSAYLKGDFELAARIFGEILSEHPHDGPSQLFLRRSRALLKSPPKSEWLGIWNS